MAKCDTILFVNTLYHPHLHGGAERSVQLLAESFARMGIRAVVLTSAPEGCERVAEHNGVEVHYVPQRNIYRWPPGSQNAVAKAAWHALDAFNPFMAGVVKRIGSKIKPSVIHTNTLAGFSVSTWAAAESLGIPVVHTIRDYYLLCPSTTMFRDGANCGEQCQKCAAYSWPKKRASQAVAAVVGISQHVLNTHLERGYFSRTSVREVVGNICERPENSGEVLHFPNGKLRLGYLGRVHPSKGIEVFLDAVSKLDAGKVEAFVGGEGEMEYEKSLRARFTAPNVHFLGVVEPKNLFSQIDALVVPSRWHEPLSRVVLESHSWGVPVVASRRGGIVEIVEDGKTGFGFDPDKPNELGELLAGLNPDRCRAMRENCLARTKEFSPGKIVNQYLEVFERVC
jgi:glycosyltransferase involved in cell wall biosynthesis